MTSAGASATSSCSQTEVGTDGPTFHLVVNPSAGHGRAAKLLPRVRERLEAVPGAEVVVHSSTSYAHAEELCRTSAARARRGREGRGRDALVVMGGDGMAHLGLNACADARAEGLDVPLGVVPAGTDNDFCRGVGLATESFSAVEAIVAGHTRRIDLSEVTGQLRDGAEHRFVGSVVSTGYDARVNLATNTFPHPIGPLGSLAYGAIALAELARFAPLDYRLWIDGQTREISSVLVAVANAGHFGGGMKVLPDARVDDGLLDVVLVGSLTRRDVLRLLPKLYRGSHVHEDVVEVIRAREVRIDGASVARDGSRGTMFAMADGELLGDVPITITCRPGLLDVFASVGSVPSR